MSSFNLAPSLMKTTAAKPLPDGAIDSLKSRISHGSGTHKHERIKKASQDFEATFLAEMLNHMFDGIDVDPTFGGGKGEETFRSLLVDEYGKIITKAGGIGVADAVAKEFIKHQEVIPHEQSTQESH
ncbi:MAG: rod-binding protein [Alphaproteobacteria bacterium]|nr:rod-binding protein [Alphaproteobacteria bacterium]